MANKTITMSVTQGNSRISFTSTLSDSSTWMAQSYMFHRYLLAQGYVLDAEAVGADLEDYIHAEATSEEF